ncbi:MAG: phosphotransferase family protein [Rhizobiaceae bacterium]|nr:MAG: phosphotransferase family protein [Rhizobiaceae bacterium]
MDRQALFSGTEAPPAHLALDLRALERYLQGRLPGLDGPLAAEKFRGGQSNPTYLLSCGDRRWVLRRQPPGKLMPSAHAIDREYRVIAAMARAGIAVPAVHLFCEDAEVIGSTFYIVDFVAGRLFWDAELPKLAPDERTAIYRTMVESFAKIHMVDVAAAGLSDFGASVGYAARNLSRWSRIYDEARLADIADMDWLATELRERLPDEGPATLIHGDYGLYNILFHSERAEVSAILDWEMATLGNPWIDLAHHLRAWWEPKDESGSATSLAGFDLASLGIPTMEDYVALYAAARGIEPPRHFAYYLAFAQFRYAAMVQGVLKRAAIGTASSRTMLHTQDKVFRIAALARNTLESGQG